MGGLFILAAAWGVGGQCLSRLGIRPCAEAIMLRFALGLPWVAALALLIGSFSLTAAEFVVALLAVLSMFPVVRHFLQDHDVPAAPKRSFTPLEWVAIAMTTGALAFTALGALAPVTGWDATVAHLALPQDYAQQGRITVQPGNVYSGYPQLVQTLYSLCIGGPGVALLHVALLVATAAAAANLGRAAFSRQTGLLAALVVVTSPIFVDQAAAPGVDIPFLAFTLLGLTCVWRWRQTATPGWLLAAGLLIGASCGIRHTGLLCGALLVPLLVLVSRRMRFAAPAIFSGGFLLAAAPWLIRSWVVTGNPVFPFLLEWFPNGPIPHIRVGGLGIHESTPSFSWIEFIRFPWDIVMRPSDFDGWNKSPGGLVLALGIPGLLLGGRAAWTLGGFSIFGGAVFYFFQRLARYLLPFFGPMMIVAAAVPNRSRRLRWIALAVLLASGVAGLGLHAAALSVKLPVIIGQVDRDTYLAARVERYEAFAHANQIWQRGGKILSLDQRTYYLDPPSYQNHWGLIEIRSMPLADQVAWLRAQGIAYVLLPLDFVRESGVLRDELMPMLQAWRNAPEYFTLVHTMQTPRRDAKGLETIEFYALAPLPEEES